MAHNLAETNGTVAMAYQGETPWHQLGVRLPSITSVDQALEAAGLNYTVRTEALYLADGTPVPMRKAVLRNDDNRVLGTAGADYGILQHVDAFRELNVLCTDHGMTIESAGALGQGERVWMLFKLPETVTPIPGDDLRGYMLATTGHDGKWAHVNRLTPMRVVCQNTLDAAGGTEVVRFFHTTGNSANAGLKFKEAARVVAAMVDSFQKTGETFAGFAARKMSEAEVIRFIETLFPEGEKPSPTLDERRKKVADLVWSGVGAELARSSTNGAPNVWAAYNAVTEYFDHVRPAEAKSPVAVRRANESALFGPNADMKLRALKLARQVVAA